MKTKNSFSPPCGHVQLRDGCPPCFFHVTLNAAEAAPWHNISSEQFECWRKVSPCGCVQLRGGGPPRTPHCVLAPLLCTNRT